MTTLIEKDRQRAELLAEGFQPSELRWCRSVEQWGVTNAGIFRIERRRRYRIGFICGICADVALWLHRHGMQLLAGPFYWVVNVYEGK